MKRKWFVLYFIVFMVMLAGPAFAGGSSGPSASAAAGANANAGVDNNFSGKVTGINTNNNSLTGINTNSNKLDNTNVLGQKQQMQQSERQGQGQSSVNNVQGGNSFSGVSLVTPVPSYIEEHPRWNDLVPVMIENGVSVFTTSSIRAFYAGLTNEQRDVIKNYVKFSKGPAPPVSGAPAISETLFLHGQVPKGIPGTDYFIVDEFKMYAEPDKRCSLNVDGLWFKDLAAERAIASKANYFTILAAGSDQEQRNSTASIGIGGGNGISNGFINAGFGFGKSSSNKQSRPWCYVKLYYIPPASVYRDCSNLERQLDRLYAEREQCTRSCYNNLDINISIGDTDAELEKCSGNFGYLYKAEEAYKRALDNASRAYDKKTRRTDIERGLAKLYDHWSYAIYRIYGDPEARKFATDHNLENGYVKEIR